MMIRMKKCRNQIILSTENIRSMLSWSLHSAGSLTTEVIPTHQWRRTPAPQWWTYHRRSPPLKTPLVHLFMSDISGRPVPVSDISWYRCLSYICVHQILVDVQCLCLISLDIGVCRISVYRYRWMSSAWVWYLWISLFSWCDRETWNQKFLLWKLFEILETTKIFCAFWSVKMINHDSFKLFFF